MSMASNLRIVKNKAEIEAVLTKIFLNDTPVLIWQKENEKKRFLNTAQISNVNNTVGVFHLRSTSGDWLSEIRNELSLYFKGDEESILFKSKNIIQQKDELIIPIPSEVRLLEKRYVPRLTLDINNPRNVFLLSKIVEGGVRKQFVASIYDVSLKGAAIRIPKLDSKFFYEGDTLSIVKIGMYPLDPVVSAKVMYLKGLEYTESGLKKKVFRVGLKFQTELTSDQINFFNKR